jgi:hypothetical protein
MWFQQGAIFALCLLVLLRTAAPSIYFMVDSSEYAIGATTLGIVHAPGYPLYLLVAHLFAQLPLGDIAYRVNLLSVVALALSAAFFYGTAALLLGDRWVAFGTTLAYVWSYYVWQSGVAAEVYAPQLATLTALGWALASHYRAPTARKPLLIGALFGVAVAFNPSSVFFAPGLVVAFLLLRVPLRVCVAAGLLALALFALPLAYFPLRYAADPAFNTAGVYGADGSFNAVNLATPAGVWWILRGAQFNSLFFDEGLLPSWHQLTETVSFFWGNFLGIGVISGLIGLVALGRQKRGLLAALLVFFLPYTYFFSTYGAVDRDTMFGPSFMVWSLLLGFGLQWFVASAPRWWRYAAIAVLPLLLLVVNGPIVDASQVTGARDHAEQVVEALPHNAIVFGSWLDIITAQYLTIVEHQRPDLTLYNLYYFPDQDFKTYLRTLVTQHNRPVVFLSNEMDNAARTDYVQAHYTLRPLQTTGSDESALGYLVTGAGP